MRLHLKILGVTYTLLAALAAALALIFLTHAFASGERAGAVPLIPMGLSLWLLQTGLGLWKRRRGARLLAALTAAVLVPLNLLLLFPGSDKLAPTAERAAFHAAFIALGLYTLFVVLHPRTKAELI